MSVSYSAEIDGLAALRAVAYTLQRIDPRLVQHGERVAFIACEICEYGNLPINVNDLLLASLFHDIGAYKTDEIDRMVEFETVNVNNHAKYGYLFMKYMTPLSELCEVILYHHTKWNEMTDKAIDVATRDCAALISLADRIDIAHLYRDDKGVSEKITNCSGSEFCPEYVDLFNSCYKERRIYERLADGSFIDDIDKRIELLNITHEQALEYIKMLAFLIDFRSEFTVTHTMNTTCIALEIAKHFGLDERQNRILFLGAALHDVGKIAVPLEILESTGRLDDEQMRIMRTHVTETENIIRGIVSPDVLNIAVRHHEKLDGSGYPYSLTGDSLNFSERIVAVSDIVSALASTRSYKKPFPKEKTLSILREMSEDKLDKSICDYVCNSYDEIIERTKPERDGVIQRYQQMLEEYKLIN